MTETLYALNTGATIPALGLGMNMAESGRQVQAAVTHAINSGYRHIDCAYAYGNEAEVGAGIAAALASSNGSILRTDLFITTKLWCTYHTRVEQNLDVSLQLLGLDYVDLYLIHWPIAMNPAGNDEKFPKLPDGSRDLVRTRSHVDTYKDMEGLLRTGKTKAVGVCNYSKRYLEELLPNVSVVPAVNQIENHLLLPQTDIVDFCEDNGIHITAYSPLGSTGSPLMSIPNVVRLARGKGVSEGCILLSYHVAKGHSVLAKSVTPSRIQANKEIVELSPAELGLLGQVSKDGVTRFVYPEFGVDFGFVDKA